MVRWGVLLVFVFHLSSSMAQAKEVKIGSSLVTLVAPPAFCELDENSRSAKSLRDLLGGRNQLLASYADCDSKSSLPLDNFANYTTPRNQTANLPVGAIKQVCATLRTKGDERLAAIMRDRLPDMQRLFNDVKVNEVRFLGVISEEADVCYSAQAQSLVTESGVDKRQISISAATVIHGKFIVFNLYAPLKGNISVSALLDKHKRNVAALIAANPN